MAYSEKVIDHYENPRNVGSFDNNDENVGSGMVGAPACGDVEIGLAGNIFTPGLRLRLVDQPGVKIGVNRHLFAGHRVQGKAGRNLGNTLGPLGDDDKVDCQQRQ